jgi:hypothetical protein
MCKVCIRLGKVHKQSTIEKLKIPKSVEHKLKISKGNLGKKRTVAQKLHMSKIKTGIWTHETNPSNLSHVRQQRRERAICRLKETFKNFIPAYNEKACNFIEILNNAFGWNLQHAKNGGEISICGYFLDGYDKERNIAFEFDEPRHFYDLNYQRKDVIKQNEISKKLNCIFIRWNDLNKNFVTSDSSLVERLEEVRHTVA